MYTAQYNIDEQIFLSIHQEKANYDMEQVTEPNVIQRQYAVQYSAA